MNYKFLNKVVDQIVSETRIDHDGEKGRMYTPFFHSEVESTLVFDLFSSLYSSSNYLFTFFIKHCKDVYGLNHDEVDYVWEEYKDIIKDKIENNG